MEFLAWVGLIGGVVLLIVIGAMHDSSRFYDSISQQEWRLRRRATRGTPRDRD